MVATQHLPSFDYPIKKTGHELPILPVEANVLHRTLRAVTAQQNGRYSREFIVCPAAFSIRAGSNRPIIDSVSPWIEWTHPEGMPYFYHPSNRVITDSYIRDSRTLKNLHLHIEDLWNIISERAIALSEDCDIFVQLEDDLQVCNYYIVDHASRTLCWLDEVNSEDIGLPWATCGAQQKHALAEEYWAHVEFFPHRMLGIPMAALELANILTFGRGDQLTSDNSTFPYKPKQCAEFLDMIRTSRQEGQEFIWFIARIWTVIARHRFDTYHGQQYARINRDQRRLGPRTVQRPFGMRMLELILFRAPQLLEQELELLHVDDLVYTIHWRKFISARMAEWKQASLYAMGVMLAQLILLQSTADSLARSIGLAGTMFSVASLIMSTGLLQKYNGAEQLHATDAVERVRALDHQIVGFQAAAAVFSLPRAFQMWSLLILSLQITFAGILNGPTSVVFIATVALVFGCIVLATVVATAFERRFEDSDRTWWGRLLPGCHCLFGYETDTSPPV